MVWENLKIVVYLFLTLSTLHYRDLKAQFELERQTLMLIYVRGMGENRWFLWEEQLHNCLVLCKDFFFFLHSSLPEGCFIFHHAILHLTSWQTKSQSNLFVCFCSSIMWCAQHKVSKFWGQHNLNNTTCTLFYEPTSLTAICHHHGICSLLFNTLLSRQTAAGLQTI